MASLHELATTHTELDEPSIDHLLRLNASSSLLADLSFSDLLLMAPVKDEGSGPARFVVLGQIRPNNRATVVHDDLLGTRPTVDKWPLAKLAIEGGTLVNGVTPVEESDPLTTWAIPVRFHGRLIAVLVRLQGALRGPASLYEGVYMNAFERLCAMVSEGSYPFREEDVVGPGLPRVGDGVLLLDAEGVVEFATPNASNAMHRLGVYTQTEGHRLHDVEHVAHVVKRALEFGIPSLDEVTRGHDVAIFVMCIPLLAHGQVTGVLILLRDVSDLRQLDRAVVMKDAAIREVHHRVKNNLQTISSLLRLQGRRSQEPETINALREAERRVRSIAVVHEVLSREPGEQVAFRDIVKSLVDLVEDSVLVSHDIDIVVNGDLGTLSTDVATPLAVVIAELLTNAVEHAFLNFDEAGDAVGIVTLNLHVDEGIATAEIRDNGSGLGADFSLERPTSLGLSIVRDLVQSQLRGRITMNTVPSDDGGGTLATVTIPLRGL
jgi:two-component sensor histidine kinase